MEGLTVSRTNALTMFAEHINNESRCKNLEISIYNWATTQNDQTTKNEIRKKSKKKINDKDFRIKEVDMIYRKKVRSIFMNLTNEKNPLKANINDGVIKVKDIPTMKPHELYPKIWEDSFFNIARKEWHFLTLQEKMKKNEIIDGAFTCKRCKSKQTTHYSIQTRSADEPMTTYVTCKNCSCVWKE